MKTKIFTLLMLAIPFLINAQDLTIATGAVVTIGDGASMTVGEITNTAATQLIIESGGSLIYSNTVNPEPYATVKRTIDTDGWHFVSPTTTGITAQDFFIDAGHDAWLAAYTEGTGAWEYFVDPLTGAISPGHGYTYWWTNNNKDAAPGVVTYTGQLESNVLEVTVTRGTDDTYAGFNLVGNPFAATYDLQSAIDNGTPPITWNPDIEKSIWIWDQTLNNGDGGYQWASVDNSYPPPVDEIDARLTVGQGVFIRVLVSATGGSTTVNIDPVFRTHVPTDFWKKSSKNTNSEIQFLRIDVDKGAKGDFGIVGFAEGGSTGFENGLDVSKIFAPETVPQVYFVEEGTWYARNHLSSLLENEERIVNMYFTAGENGEQTLTANFDYLALTDVYLEDLVTDEMIFLNDNPNYTFNANVGETAHRFNLHFKYSPTDIEEDIFTVGASLGIYAHEKAVYITNKDNNSFETSNIVIYDMYGRQVYSDKAQLGKLTRIPVQVNNTYLVVRVIKGSNTYTEKVFIK